MDHYEIQGMLDRAKDEFRHDIQRLDYEISEVRRSLEGLASRLDDRISTVKTDGRCIEESLYELEETVNDLRATVRKMDPFSGKRDDSKE